MHAPSTRSPQRTATGGGPAEPGDARVAPFGVALAFTVVLLVAVFLIVMSAVLLPIPSGRTPPPFQSVEQQNPAAKAALYVGLFAVMLPAAVVLAPRLADRIAAGPNRAALPALAAILVGTLAAALIVVRMSARSPWGDGLGTVLVAVIGWSAVAVAALARAVRRRPWRALLLTSDHAFPLTVTAAALVVLTLVGTTSRQSLSALPMTVGVVVIPLVLWLSTRRSPPTLPRPWGAGVDAVVIALTLLAVPDLVVFATSGGTPTLFSDATVIGNHHDFLLGPANQVLAGDALLVDAPVSQYGVTVLYALAAWFRVAPIGHGTYALLDGVLTALLYASAYAVLRIARLPRLTAVPVLALGIVVLVYKLDHPVGALPQLGPLRFGMPMLVVLAATAGARYGRYASACRISGFAILAVASVWAIEMFAYTLVTLAAVIGVSAVGRPPGRRARWLTRQALWAASACASAHLIFAAVTVVVAGEPPDWSQYAAFVRALLFSGSQSEVSFPYARWSPALALGAGYAASIAAILLVLRRCPDVGRRHAPTFVAIVGATAYGVALMSYANSRSSTYLLLYVALPELMAGALWLQVLLQAPTVSARTRLAGVGAALATAVLLLSTSWTAIDVRLPRSALGHLWPGGPSLGGAVTRLWNPPPLDSRAPEGQRLLATYDSGRRRSLVLLPDALDLGVEVLIRSGRANRLPIGDPRSEDWIASARRQHIARAVAGLRAGEIALLDDAALSVVDPRRGLPVTADRDGGLTVWTLRRIATGFDLRPVHRGSHGFVVVRLVPRRGRHPAG